MNEDKSEHRVMGACISALLTIALGMALYNYVTTPSPAHGWPTVEEKIPATEHRRARVIVRHVSVHAGADLLYGEAIRLEAEDRQEEARERFQKVIKLDARFPWVYVALAERTEDQKEKVELYSRAIALRDESRFFRKRAEAYRALGKPDEQLKDLYWVAKLTATAKTPEQRRDRAHDRSTLGHELWNRNKFDDAYAQFRQMLNDADPTDEEGTKLTAVLNMCGCLKDLGRWKEVIALLEQHPLPGSRAWDLATCPVDSIRDPQAAIRLLDRLEAADKVLEGDQVRAAAIRAAALANLERYQDAIELLTSALRKDAESKQLHQRICSVDMGGPGYADQFEKKYLSLYRVGKPYRQRLKKEVKEKPVKPFTKEELDKLK